MRIYLSGGMHSEWQDRVISTLPQFEYLDPRKKNLKIPVEYIAWDLFYIRQADICLVYIEKDNPSGVGLALECGYAKALGKLVILVDEKGDKYFQIVQATADVVFYSLDEGIRFLREFDKCN